MMGRRCGGARDRMAATRRRTIRAFAPKSACALLFVLLAACSSQQAPPSAALPPVALPDLSRVEKSVQEQIGAAYQALTSKSSDAEAYGALGNLLLAAEYFDAAEPCYLHAQSIAPADPRWPYYLG